jgi:UDP-N-acetylglucosamine diphosphorylase/glucosamine-1-phosphate N-acetyltransferase
MNYILFDDASSDHLLPFTHTRPVADIRCGILTMRERWEARLFTATSSLTRDYLTDVFAAHQTGDDTYINGSIFASAELAAAINGLMAGQQLVSGDLVIAARVTEGRLKLKELQTLMPTLAAQHYTGELYKLSKVWDIFLLNDRAIRDDFELVTKGRKSAAVPEGVTVSGAAQLFIEEGAQVYAGCIINATTGPVYIGKDSEVLEGTLIRGPLATGEHSVIKMGAKIYGATTIGPGCKVGGEINNTIFFANSNKAHDGYLGNAVIGEWCNLGADTNCSNLKNNYDEIKIWSEASSSYVYTGLTFCGLLMGDHSKCAINSMFNTGTVVGASCNIFGGGFPEKFVPSFSWGGSEKITTYAFDRAMDTANRMMARRGKKLSAAETAMYREIYERTAVQRALAHEEKGNAA